MTHYNQQIEKLEQSLERVNETIANYQKTARAAGGRVSEVFTHHLDTAIEQRDRLALLLTELRTKEAVSWSPIESPLEHLETCDEMRQALNATLRKLDSNAP